MNSLKGIPDDVDGPRTRVDMGETSPDLAAREAERTLQNTHDEVAAAIAAAEESVAGRSARDGAHDGGQGDAGEPAPE